MSCGAENPDDVERLFPAGSVPGTRFDTVSSLCSTGMRPYAMTGFLRQLLLQHYADPENIADPVQRTRFQATDGWKPGETTGLLIESITRWRPELAEKRPSVLIKRNAWHWERFVIGDNAGDNMLTGTQFFSGFWYGSHTIFCMAPNPAEAEALGMETLFALLAYGPFVVQQMSLMRFLPSEIGELACVEEASEHYTVPLTFAYVAEEAWQVDTDAPRLKRYIFRKSDLI